MTLKMKALLSFRMAINIYQSVCPSVPEDTNPQYHRRGADVATGDGMEC
jgi:hypothetical protein